VAKERMNCPFTNRLCEECALYRGRHYYLCYCREYRGYLGKPGEFAERDSTVPPGNRSNSTFEIPPIIPGSAVDPFVVNHESHQEEEV
jgi:hypothetical protein